MTKSCKNTLARSSKNSKWDSAGSLSWPSSARSKNLVLDSKKMTQTACCQPTLSKWIHLSDSRPWDSKPNTWSMTTSMVAMSLLHSTPRMVKSWHLSATRLKKKDRLISIWASRSMKKSTPNLSWRTMKWLVPSKWASTKRQILPISSSLLLTSAETAKWKTLIFWEMAVEGEAILNEGRND